MVHDGVHMVFCATHTALLLLDLNRTGRRAAHVALDFLESSRRDHLRERRRRRREEARSSPERLRRGSMLSVLSGRVDVHHHAGHTRRCCKRRWRQERTSGKGEMQLDAADLPRVVLAVWYWDELHKVEVNFEKGEVEDTMFIRSPSGQSESAHTAYTHEAAMGKVLSRIRGMTTKISSAPTQTSPLARTPTFIRQHWRRAKTGVFSASMIDAPMLRVTGLSSESEPSEWPLPGLADGEEARALLGGVCADINRTILELKGTTAEVDDLTSFGAELSLSASGCTI